MLIRLVEKKGISPAAPVNPEVKKTLQMLNAARKRIILEIAQTPADKWMAYYLPNLKTSIEKHMADFAKEYQISVAQWQEMSFDSGILDVDNELKGGTLRIAALHDISRAELELAKSYSATKVVGLANETRDKINSAITLGLLGEKSPFEVIKDIGRNLTDPSIFRNTAVRAEMITRTEMNNVLSMARQMRQNQAAQYIPGLKKRWIYNHFPGKFGRTGHMALHGVTVDVKDSFSVAPTKGGNREPMKHPHDFGASAANVVGCKCVCKTILPEDAQKEEATPKIPAPKNDYQRDTLKKYD